jgi:hypothetical protein
MTELSKDLGRMLVRELDGFRREVALFPDDNSLWTTVRGVTNSAGNLALHVAGNLQHFVGVVLGGSSYRRNRDDEFGRKSGTRAEVMSEIEAAIAAVRAVLPDLSEAQLDAVFPEAVMGTRLPTRRFLIHLCAHAAFHLGQAGYVRRVVTGESRSSGSLPVEALAD